MEECEDEDSLDGNFEASTSKPASASPMVMFVLRSGRLPRLFLKAWL